MVLQDPLPSQGGGHHIRRLCLVIKPCIWGVPLERPCAKKGRAPFPTRSRGVHRGRQGQLAKFLPSLAQHTPILATFGQHWHDVGRTSSTHLAQLGRDSPPAPGYSLQTIPPIVCCSLFIRSIFMGVGLLLVVGETSQQANTMYATLGNPFGTMALNIPGTQADA